MTVRINARFIFRFWARVTASVIFSIRARVNNGGVKVRVCALVRIKVKYRFRLRARVRFRIVELLL